MDNVKRKLTFNQSSEEKPKKFRIKDEFDQSITCIENLSNELFYEIFDYLDGCEIYKAFSNINNRFKQLLNCSFLLFKIKHDDDYSLSRKKLLKTYKQIILYNKQQIYSIHVWSYIGLNKFFSLFHINSSFNHLESISLSNTRLKKLQSFLMKLSCLPRLLSLTICVQNICRNFNDVYQLIFTLPMLKYNKFYAYEDKNSISRPMVINKQQSRIECLIIAHSCAFNQLLALLSNTSELRYLKCLHKKEIDSTIKMILPIKLLNLKHISIEMDYVKFDEFEMFISKLYSKLEVLSIINKSQDPTYLNAYEWERLIEQYLPQLKKFYFKFYKQNPNRNHSPVYFQGSKQFFSSFWIERQWLFEVKINDQHTIYSIQPYRERWYEYDKQHEVINSCFQLSRPYRLTLMYIHNDQLQKLITTNIDHVLTISQIYHLEITEEKIFIGLLIQIIDCLPLLGSIKIHSLSLYGSRNLTEKEIEIFSLIEDTSIITKVYLQNMIEFYDIHFLMALCPYMAFLKIGFINNMNIEVFLHYILKKINYQSNDYLRLLCVHVPTEDDQMINKLEKMINDEKLLVNYSIKRVLYDIYLQLK